MRRNLCCLEYLFFHFLMLWLCPLLSEYDVEVSIVRIIQVVVHISLITNHVMWSFVFSSFTPNLMSTNVTNTPYTLARDCNSGSNSSMMMLRSAWVSVKVEEKKIISFDFWTRVSLCEMYHLRIYHTHQQGRLTRMTFRNIFLFCWI